MFHSTLSSRVDSFRLVAVFIIEWIEFKARTIYMYIMCVAHLKCRERIIWYSIEKGETSNYKICHNQIIKMNYMIRKFCTHIRCVVLLTNTYMHTD